MGNCFTCFKVPTPGAAAAATTTDADAANHCHKEEMPEVRLYPAPSHIASHTNSDIDQPYHYQYYNNGNNKSIVVTAVNQTTAATTTTTTTTTTSTTTTTTTTASSLGALVTVQEHNTSGGGGGGSLSRFYQRRSGARCTHTNIMGAGDSKVSETKLNALFDVYKDAHEDAILAEGIEQLCMDLQVSPDEFRVLVFAWKLNAEQMCRFTRTEFVQGCRAMHTDSIKSIQHRLPELVTEVERDLELFRDLYRFTFRFGLDVATGQRILPIDMAVCLWRLVFTIREPPILGRWLRFLELHPQFRGIPRDTWNMFLNFVEAVGDDLSSYDDTEAWPSLFDDFVEYENDHVNQNVTSKDKESDSLLITNEH